MAIADNTTALEELLIQAQNLPERGGGDTPEAPESDVNFYGLNAKRLYSYTLEEAQALTSLPGLPTDPVNDVPMTYSWVVTLATINALTSANIPYNVCVAAVPADGKTHIHIKLNDGRLSPYLGIAVNGSVDVDWGDDSIHDTMTGTSTSSTSDVVYAPQHTYTNPGEYEIKLSVTGSASIMGHGTGGSFLLTRNAEDQGKNYVYHSSIIAVEIGENITVGVNGFQNCFSLKSITIPNDTGLFGYAFRDCRSLEYVTIPSSIRSLNVSTFYSCSSLLSVAIPSSLTTLPASTFRECDSLLSISIPRSITSLGNYCFDGCNSISSIVAPNSVSGLGTHTFYNCYSLKSIQIPFGVGSIGSNEFYMCYSLESIAIPNSVTSIGMYAFQSCYSLSSITIPSSVTEISSYAFQRVEGVGFIKFEGTAPPSVSNANAFAGVPVDCKIVVPAGTLSDYETATNYPDPNTYTYEEY